MIRDYPDSTVNVTLKRVEELATNAPARLVILYEKNLRLPNPARIDGGTLFTAFCGLNDRRRDLLRFNVWDVVDVAAVHRINTIRVANRVDDIVEIAI